MKGYYTRHDIIEACRGLSGLVELVKRGDEWQHVYPPHNKAEIRIMTPEDYRYEDVSFDQIKEGFEYGNGVSCIKIIDVKDAPNYLMPKRW